MVIKIISKGFVCERYTYLRSPWNWLDFVVILSGFVTLGSTVGNLAGLRTFRVLRALKTVSIMPGLKTIINALLHSFRQLAEVMTLTIFCLMVFALFALQVYMGELRNKCVRNFSLTYKNSSNITWSNWISDDKNWLRESDEPFSNSLICGNATGARSCPHGYTCIRTGPNPNYGFTCFDNFLWAMLTTFQLITLDYWENIYNMLIAACGPISCIIFFIVVVFFGSFYLINLMLAVVSLSYEEEAAELSAASTTARSDGEVTEDRIKDLSEHRHDSTFSFGAGGTGCNNFCLRRLTEQSFREKLLQDAKRKQLLANYRMRAPRRTKKKSNSSNTPVSSRSNLTSPKTGEKLVNVTQQEESLLPHELLLLSSSSQKQLLSVDSGNTRSKNTHFKMAVSCDSGVVEDLQQINDEYTVEPSRSVERQQQFTKTTVTKKQIVIYDNRFENRHCSSAYFCFALQKHLLVVVHDSLFELFITLCIILNTLFLAFEHHGMSHNLHMILNVGNQVFTSIFTIECALKLLALKHQFFECGWNVFDLIIVTASMLDLIFELIDGLSVLRGLRLLRVLKLAKSWTTMKVLLSIIISSIGALGNLTFVLIIVIYIFAVIGMQLFSKEYTEEKFYPDPVPRWNFNDFFHSFMMIFRILCGEWIEPLWDCMRVQQDSSYGACLAVFLPALVMGNFMVLNLFLALLLNSFNTEELKTRKEEVADDSQLLKSFQRIRSLFENITPLRTKKDTSLTYVEPLLQLSHYNLYNRSYHEAMNEPLTMISYEDDNDVIIVKDDCRRFLPLHPAIIAKTNATSTNTTTTLPRYEELYRNEAVITQLLNSTSGEIEHQLSSNRNRLVFRKMSSGFETQPSTFNEDDIDATDVEEQAIIASATEGKRLSTITKVLKDDQDVKSKCLNSNNAIGTVDTVSVGVSDSADKRKSQQWRTLISYVDTLTTIGRRKNSHGEYVTDQEEVEINFPSFGSKKPVKTPDMCFPQNCYTSCTFWDACSKTKFGHKFSDLRFLALQVVDNSFFEWAILVLIFASSITLCFEDIHLESNKSLKKILYWTNLVFCIIFVFEMFLKWMALGLYKYFRDFWTVLDFIIVFVSIVSLLVEENENLKVLRSLRTLRALRPLRAISRWQGMRIVVNALMYAIPSIFNVLLVCIVFWLIFSIMGVQFFAGKFYKCVDATGNVLSVDVVANRNDCLAANYTWQNSKIHFDHVGAAYLALFQVATFEGWMEIMADAADARGLDLQPERESNLAVYIYFVVFITCGSFFTLNLFIGVIIDNFNMLKKKYEGGVLEMFLTESQKHYYTAMKKLGRKKPQKVIKRPLIPFLAFFYDLTNSRRFEIAIFILIFLNMVSMGIEHYDQPPYVYLILEIFNSFFTTIFALEAIIKMLGLRYHYFTVPWNVFDFLLVLASIFDILMEDIMIELPISPTLLRVIRVFRIGRILRLIKAAKGIRKLLFALIVSLPALFNIGALLALITFIYAIIGMTLFGHVKRQGVLDDMVNFETFGCSMQLLFRLMTSAGWNDVLESLMVQAPDCEPEIGNCGSKLPAIIYFISFIIINYMIVINMYIAIILENFNQAHQEEEIGIVEDDLEMFYITWSKYDPHATQFIAFDQLSDFINALDPPLRIAKPNIVALVSFNLPIAKGNKIHCLDILHSLVKHVLGHVEETETFKQLQDQMDDKFKKQFPTRKELEIVSSTRLWKRQDKAARLIQKRFKAWAQTKWIAELSADEHGGATGSLTSSAPPTPPAITQSSSAAWHSRLSSFLNIAGGGSGMLMTSTPSPSRKSSRSDDGTKVDYDSVNDYAIPLKNLPNFLFESTIEMTDNEGTHTVTRNSNGVLRHQDAIEQSDDESLVQPTTSFLNQQSLTPPLPSNTSSKSKAAATLPESASLVRNRSLRIVSGVSKSPEVSSRFSRRGCNRSLKLLSKHKSNASDASINQAMSSVQIQKLLPEISISVTKSDPEENEIVD